MHEKTNSDLHIIKTVMKFIITSLMIFQMVMICFFYFLKSNELCAIFTCVLLGVSGVIFFLILLNKVIFKEKKVVYNNLKITPEISKKRSYRNPVLKDKVFKQFLVEYKNLGDDEEKLKFQVPMDSPFAHRKQNSQDLTMKNLRLSSPNLKLDFNK